MSVIAGVISLKPHSSVSGEMVPSMLNAMRPEVLESQAQCYLSDDKRVAIGKLSYRPETATDGEFRPPAGQAFGFCTGEIYNDDRPAGQSAIDYLLARYKRTGADGFARDLNGSFAAVIFDPKDSAVSVITDHTSARPVFTVICNDVFYFSSEVKGLMAISDIACQPDIPGVVSLMVNEFFALNRTLVSGVRKMDYATVCRVKDGKIQYQPYWRYSVEPDEGVPHKKLVREFADVVRGAVKRRTRDGRIAILLSGGIDSRGILCCMDSLSGLRAATFTCRREKDRSPVGDVAISGEICSRLKIPFDVIYHDPAEFVDSMRSSIYASDAAAGFIFQNIWDQARQKTDAEYLLMGDECMGWTYGITSRAGVFPLLGMRRLDELEELKKIIPPDKLNSFIGLSNTDMETIARDTLHKNPYDTVDELYLREHMAHLLLPKRRVIMRHGMGVRDPWLDLEVLEFIRKVPYRYRIRKRLFCEALALINPSLASMTRARVSENVSYKRFIQSAQQKGQLVSKFILENNELLGEFLDKDITGGLVDKVCRPDGSSAEAQSFRLRSVVPRNMGLKLISTYRYFANPRSKLGGMALLLRVMTVAESLRHLSKRMGTQNSKM